MLADVRMERRRSSFPSVEAGSLRSTADGSVDVPLNTTAAAARGIFCAGSTFHSSSSSWGEVRCKSRLSLRHPVLSKLF